MSHETAPTGGVTEAEAPLYVVLGTHRGAMRFAAGRKIDDPHRNVVTEGQDVSRRLQGSRRRVVLVWTGEPPTSYTLREQTRMAVDHANHLNGFATDEISYR